MIESRTPFGKRTEGVGEAEEIGGQIHAFTLFARRGRERERVMQSS